jgi:protein-S-isoprenylcysteine O-methyltransferase Ste14
VRLRATWPLPVAAVLILVGLIYLQGPLSAQVIGLALLIAGAGLVAWTFTSRRAVTTVNPPRT